MVNVDIKGCASFIEPAKYDAFVNKALDAFDVLESEKGAGNDFLGWKHLPSEVSASILEDIDGICHLWKEKGVDLVIAIGIGGSYLGAKCVIEALSHNFAKQLKHKDAPEVVFAGNNLSEEYLAELMDLAAERNVACIVISKSGTTTEPAVAFRIVKQFIEERYGKIDAAQRIVAITDATKGALKPRRVTRLSSFPTTWAADSPSLPRSACCPSPLQEWTSKPFWKGPARPKRPSR